MFLQGLSRGVLIPSLAKIQDDQVKLGKEYLLVLRMLALVVFPVLMGMFIMADDFVALLYGPNWAGAVPTLKILCLVGMIQVTPTGWLFAVTGKTSVMMRLSFLTTIVTVAAFIIGVQYGTVEGVAISYLVANFILIWPLALVPCRMIGLEFTKYLASIFKPLAVSSVMAAAVFGLKFYFFKDQHYIYRIITFVPVGALIHVTLVKIFFPYEFSHLLKLFKIKQLS
jgi:PST family polysaccharide transporter